MLKTKKAHKEIRTCATYNYNDYENDYALEGDELIEMALLCAMEDEEYNQSDFMDWIDTTKLVHYLYTYHMSIKNSDRIEAAKDIVIMLLKAYRNSSDKEVNEVYENHIELLESLDDTRRDHD